MILDLKTSQRLVLTRDPPLQWGQRWHLEEKEKPPWDQPARGGVVG